MAVTPGPPPTPTAPVTPVTSLAPSTAAISGTRLGCGRDVDDVWDHIEQPPSAHERTCPYCTQARADLAGLAAATREMTAADRTDPSLHVSDRMMADVLAIVRTEVRRGRTIPLQRRVPGPRPWLDETTTSSTAGANTAGTADESTADDADDLDPAADLTVSEQVIAAVVRAVCDQNPDVEVGRVSIRDIPASVSDSPVTVGSSANEPNNTNDPENPENPDNPDDPDDPEGGGGRAAGLGARWGQDLLEPVDVRMSLQARVRHGVAIPGLVEGLRGVIRSTVAAEIGVTVSRVDIEIKDLIDV